MHFSFVTNRIAVLLKVYFVHTGLPTAGQCPHIHIVVPRAVRSGLASLKQVWKHAVRKQNTFLLPNSLLPCLRTTRRKEFNNMYINNAYLTLWLCLSFLGLDYVLLSCYPTPFLGCICAVSFTAE